ncbi:MAG: hypothetical protein GF418_10930, partial [Chitinivibrionales bacterium]|nr:hypothetical protein [Chitinivibrionales bacterium]MBD3396129.1 hypothetical protein [Chitinivibrionales bacterium]
RPVLTPVFRLSKSAGRNVLVAAGNGRDNCVGHVAAPLRLDCGRTYRLKVRFRMSADINPHKNLLFVVFGRNPQKLNNGIQKYKKLARGRASGEQTFHVPGRGTMDGEIRIYFRYSARGKVWIESVSLEKCAPIPPRPVRLCAVEGRPHDADWAKVLDAAGKQRADLVLLPEYMNGHTRESLNGPSAKLMARKAKRYKMYVAGGIVYKDRKTDTIYNTALLFNRTGKRVGHFSKIHPFSPETLDEGITPGADVPVFKTDFGTVGILICYDSWFTDVAELLALKGAEVILFPNVLYYRSLMHARAADNCVRIVASDWGNCDGNLAPCGIWDTAGLEAGGKNTDVSVCTNAPRTYSNVRKLRVGKARIVAATLDFAQSPSPHNWGGPFRSAPGGRRFRRDQMKLLYQEIQREVERWWEND